MHHSGDYETYTSGAQRDSAKGKPRPDLISPFAVRRLADYQCDWSQYVRGHVDATEGMTRLVYRYLWDYQQGENGAMIGLMAYTTALVALEEEPESNPSDWDVIPPIVLERLGAWLGKAVEVGKYAERNWEKGMRISRCVASLYRHWLSYRLGRTDEDHLIAVLCNAMFIVHYQEMIKRGVLPKELDDMPQYKPTINREETQ
jgi:hypothetical protein